MKHIPFILLLLFLGFCSKETVTDPTGNTLLLPELPEYPKVTSTDSNYTESAIRLRVPDTTGCNKFVRTYRNKNIDSLKNLLFDAILYTVDSLQLSTDEFRRTIDATKQFEKGVVSLPYLAERAKYENKQSWIYEFTWGVDSCDLGHYRCFVIDTSTKDTLLFITCR
jgi:hypothetical protein